MLGNSLSVTAANKQNAVRQKIIKRFKGRSSLWYNGCTIIRV